ncbi:MAG: hypothetical protein ABIP48_28275 [Planctomycetota bacterium]
MKPGIALHLTLLIACAAAPVHAAEPQQDLQAKSENPTDALDSPDVKQRIQRLRQLVQETREASARAMDSYRPTVNGPVDDLDTLVPDLLRRLPGVAKVSIHKPEDRLTHRIVHLTDWHFVPKELFARRHALRQGLANCEGSLPQRVKQTQGRKTTGAVLTLGRTGSHSMPGKYGSGT